MLYETDPNRKCCASNSTMKLTHLETELCKDFLLFQVAITIIKIDLKIECLTI